MKMADMLLLCSANRTVNGHYSLHLVNVSMSTCALGFPIHVFEVVIYLKKDNLKCNHTEDVVKPI